MSPPRFSVLSLLLAFVFGCGGPGYDGPRLGDTIGDRGVSIFRGATRVEAFRVTPVPSQQTTVKSIGGFPITATGKEQGSGFAAKLTSILLGSYVRENQKKCGLE